MHSGIIAVKGPSINHVGKFLQKAFMLRSEDLELQVIYNDSSYGESPSNDIYVKIQELLQTQINSIKILKGKKIQVEGPYNKRILNYEVVNNEIIITL